MDKKNNNFKAPENTRKTTRSGSLKSSVGSVAAENYSHIKICCV